MSKTNGDPRSKLEEALRSGEFVFTAEILPPRLPSLDSVDKKLAKLNGAGTAVNVTDNASASVKMSSLGVCAHLIQKGLDPVFQVACRDRNRLAMQSDLLSALAFGVRNVFCITGDYITMGDHPMAKPVFDIDSVHLLQIFDGIRREGVLASGVPISTSKKNPKPPPQFFLGAAANPFADPLPMHVIKLGKKIEAGADFIQTQCVFDLDRMEQFMMLARREGLHERAHILAGVMPVKSHKGLEFMRDNVPGMRIPEPLIERMKAAEDAKNEGIQFAAEMAHELRKMEGISGIHIMTPTWEEAIPAIIERAEAMHRPAPSGE